MREEEIPKFILTMKNTYEETRGIITLNVKRLHKHDGVAYYVAEKSDGTKTLFVGIRLGGRRNPSKEWTWRVFCPDAEQAAGLKLFGKFYDQINSNNTFKRLIR